ncbi:unnamed protein product [Meloidogyne enterolobii]|uniref:Uncharacterized protein n=1 Tax=Meloidogyne enterolobii TaxID=390850 RepID=A0ACB0Y2U2_MELEN
MGVSSRTNTPSTVVFDECNCSACCWGTPLPPLILQENNCGGNLLIGNNILNGNGAHGVNDNGINTHSPSFSSLLLLNFQMLMEPGIILDKYIQLMQEMLVVFMETILEYILDIIRYL